MDHYRSIKWMALVGLVALMLALVACGGAAATQSGADQVEGGPVEYAPTAGSANKADDGLFGGAEETEAPAAEVGGMGGGDAAAGAPLPEGVEADRSGADESAGAGGPPVSVPDEQFEVSLSAGEIDDNADFAAYLQYRLDFARFLGGYIQYEDVDISERHTIVVTGSDGLPLLGAEVLIYDGQNLVTSLRTQSTGVAYFFPNAYPAYASASRYSVSVKHGSQSSEFALTRDAADMTWPVKLNTAQNKQRIKLDLLFLIDATGSMSPQIEQLKENIVSISGQVEALPGDPDTQYGMVAYRDRGDVFVTRISDFTGSVRAFQRDLNDIQASGGGDTPEAMNEALHRAVWDVSWRGGDTVSIVILVADAPPHLDYAQDFSYAEEMKQAASMGLSIFPIMADTGVSGYERDQAEYVFRQIAQFTGGNFIFVTSAETPKSTGEEGTDLSVQEDAYTVENLDALVVRLIRERLEALFGTQ